MIHDLEKHINDDAFDSFVYIISDSYNDDLQKIERVIDNGHWKFDNNCVVDNICYRDVKNIK